MFIWLKSAVKNIPGLQPVTLKAGRVIGNFKSSDYWEQRYKAGGSSGSGSYNRLAQFKADFLNQFVTEHKIDSVIEHGSGDGAQLMLSAYPDYTGVDISDTAVERCRAMFAGDATKRFLHVNAVEPGTAADLALSLDVIYHLVEDRVYDAYMQTLFNSARRFVIVYSSNVDRVAPHKHIRHRQFAKWAEKHKPEWPLQSMVKNPYPYDLARPEETSFADFYVFARN